MAAGQPASGAHRLLLEHWQVVAALDAERDVLVGEADAKTEKLARLNASSEEALSAAAELDRQLAASQETAARTMQLLATAEAERDALQKRLEALPAQSRRRAASLHRHVAWQHTTAAALARCCAPGRTFYSRGRSLLGRRPGR